MYNKCIIATVLENRQDIDLDQLLAIITDLKNTIVKAEPICYTFTKSPKERI